MILRKTTRTYNGIEYSRCKSMTDVLATMRCEIEKGEGMEYELLRRGDTEPRDLQDWNENNVKEERK